MTTANPETPPQEPVWRRGTRVVSLTTGQSGVVQGRKEGRILVHWGTSDRREITSWVDRDELVLPETMKAMGLEVDIRGCQYAGRWDLVDGHAVYEPCRHCGRALEEHG